MRKLAKAKWISVLLLYTFAFGITNAEAGIRDRIRQRRTPQRASQKQTSKPTLPTVEGQQPQALSSGPQYPPPSVNSLRGTQNLPASNDGWVFTFDSSNGLWGPEAPGGGAGASDLDGLSDVVISSHTAGKYLRANGTNFVDANIALNDITGIAVVSQATGEVLRSNGTSFVDATLDFDDLANTTITSWSTGEVPRWNGSALVDSKLASTDLSDFAGTIVGNTGDILGWGGSAWDDLTMAVAITNAFGNGTDNQVLTSNGAGGVAWEDAAGGGFAIKTPDGTTTVTRLTSYNPYDYGASGDYRYAKTSGSNSAAATVINMEAGQEGYFKIGNGVAIYGAGSTHELNAITPPAPNVVVAGQSEFYRFSGNIIEMMNYRKYGDFFGYTSGYNFTADATANTITTQLPLGVDDGHAIYFTNSGGGLPGNTAVSTAYYVHLITGTNNSYSLHTSAANGISGASPIDITTAGTGTHSYWTEISVKCYSTNTLPTGLTADTQVWMRPDTSSLRRWTFHPTAADAANNTNVIALSGAGTGVHSLKPFGGKTINYRVVARSASGGLTVRSAQGSVTTAPATLRGKYGVNGWIDLISDGGGTPIYATGVDVYCDRNGSDHLFTKLCGSPTGYKVVFQAGGYVNFVPTDIGKNVVRSGNFCGKLHWYDNPTRTIVLERDYDSSDTIPNGSVITLETYLPNNYPSSQTSGVGGGTTTGTPTWVYTFTDGGDKDVDTNTRSLARKTGKCVQIVKVAGTPNGGTMQWSLNGFTFNVPYNAEPFDAVPGDTDDVKDAFAYYVPGMQDISVTAVGTTPNQTYIISFEKSSPTGMGQIPQIYVSDLTTGGTHTISVGTVIQGADYTVGDFIVDPPTSAGLTYEVESETGYRAGNLDTLSSTQNALSPDGRQLMWARHDVLSSVTSPTAAVPELYLGTVTAVDTTAHTITVSPAITSTIPDDTPVWHQDLPGIKAAQAAAAASQGGGVLEFPTAKYECWARNNTKPEWVSQIAAFQPYSLIRFNNREKSFTWNGNNSKIFCRLTNLDIYSNSTSAQNEPPMDSQGGSGVFFDLYKLDRLNVNDIDFRLVGAGEYENDSLQNESSHLFATTSSNITDDETERRSTQWKNVTWSGWRSVGTMSSSYGPDGAPDFYHCIVLYGRTAHNSPSGEGRWFNSKIERIGNWGSTAFYTAEGYQANYGLYNTRIVNPGADCIRVRSANFEMFGGSVEDLKGDESSFEQLTKAMLIEPRARNAKIIGVKFNLPVNILCQADYCCFVSNDFRNSGINLDSASVSNYCVINGNTATFNDWVRYSSSSFISVAGGKNHIVTNNTLDSQTTDTSSSGVNQNEGRRTVSGILISGSTTTNLQIGENTMNASNDAINISSSFVGNVTFTGGYYYSTDYEYNSGNETSLLQAGNGAVVTINGTTFNALTKSDEVFFGGASSARYMVNNATFLCEAEIDPALTNAGNTFNGVNFADATQTIDFNDAGTIIIDSDFATAPNLAGAGLFTKGNRVAGLAYTSVALSGSQNNYVWPVTDTVLFTTTGTNNYNIGGVVARANGSVINIVNVDSADNITVEHAGAGTTDTNDFNVNAGSNIVLGPNDGVSFIGIGQASAGWTQN